MTTEPFALSFEAEPGCRTAYVLTWPACEVVLGLQVKGRDLWLLGTWFGADGELPPEGLADWLHAQAERLYRDGFNLRRWWHLWPCWDCGAPRLAPCRAARTGRPMIRCHRGRNPRRARLS